MQAGSVIQAWGVPLRPRASCWRLLDGAVCRPSGRCIPLGCVGVILWSQWAGCGARSGRPPWGNFHSSAMVHIGACLRPICHAWRSPCISCWSVGRPGPILWVQGASGTAGSRRPSSSLGLSILPVCVLLGWAVGSAPGMYRNISSSLCSVPALSRYWGHPNLWCYTRLWVWRCVGTPQRRRLWRHTRVSSQGVGCLLRGGEWRSQWASRSAWVQAVVVAPAARLLSVRSWWLQCPPGLVPQICWHRWGWWPDGQGPFGWSVWRCRSHRPGWSRPGVGLHVCVRSGRCSPVRSPMLGSSRCGSWSAWSLCPAPVWPLQCRRQCWAVSLAAPLGAWIDRADPLAFFCRVPRRLARPRAVPRLMGSCQSHHWGRGTDWTGCPVSCRGAATMGLDWPISSVRHGPGRSWCGMAHSSAVLWALVVSPWAWGLAAPSVVLLGVRAAPSWWRA